MEEIAIKNRKKNILPYLNLTYLIWVCCYLIMYGIPQLNIHVIYYNSGIKLVNYILGFIVLFANILVKRQYKKIKFYPYIFAFVISYLVTNIITRHYGFISGMQDLFLTCVMYFEILYVGCLEEKNIKKAFKIISTILVITVTMVSLISIFMYFVGYNEYIELLGDDYFYQGSVETRLFGAFHDPNYASIVVISIICLILYFKSFEHKNNWLYNTAIVINFIYLILANSRTGKVIIYILTLLLSYIYFKYKNNHIDGKVDKSKKYIFLRVASSILALYAIFNVSMKILPMAAEGFQRTVYVYDDTDNSKNGKPKKKISGKEASTSLERDDVGEDISNNRFEIWKSAMELFKKHPVFGTSYNKMILIAEDQMPNSYLAQTGYYLHNSYLDVIVSAGIVGTILWLLLAWQIIVAIYRNYKVVNDEAKFRYALIVAVAMSVLIGGLMLSGLFFNFRLAAYITFFYCGVLLRNPEKVNLFNEAIGDENNVE